MYFAALCRADWRLFCCACGTYCRHCCCGFRSLVRAQKKSKFKNKKNFVVVCSELMIQLWIALSKKSTSPAVMFISRLALPSAVTRTEKSNTCVANLPRSQKHAHARFLLLLIVWCCYNTYSILKAQTTNTKWTEIFRVRPPPGYSSQDLPGQSQTQSLSLSHLSNGLKICPCFMSSEQN